MRPTSAEPWLVPWRQFDRVVPAIGAFEHVQTRKRAMTNIGTLSGMTALVTGATGFLGGAVARRLRAAGAIVHGSSRRRQHDGIDCECWWQADLTDADDARRILDLARPDVVFHLSGPTSAARDLDMTLPMLQANLVAIVNLLTAATQRGGVRLLFAGSSEEPKPALTWPVPSSPYAAAKLAASTYARMFYALFGTPVVCLRIFMAYGPSQRDTRKLVPYVTRSLLRGESPALSSGSRSVDWIYVDDVVEAFLAAAVAEGVEGTTLDVGSGTSVTLRTVVENLVRIIDPSIAPRFGVVPDRPLEQECVANVTDTAMRLGWQPQISLEEGLRRTVEWYRRYEPALSRAQ